MAKCVFNYNSAVDFSYTRSAMIYGYVINEMNIDAIVVFRSLIHEKMKPNVVTLSSLLPAFAGLAALLLGKELHGNILKHGLEGSCHIGSAITDMYAKCGRLDLARQCFLRMSERDVVCWNSIITSCSQNGNPVEAIDLFRRMGTEDVDYDGISISAALSAWSSLSALHCGKEIHGFMIRGSIQQIGYSWIEVNNYNHMFVAADTSHSYSPEIYFILNNLLLELRKKGYVPQTYHCTWNPVN